MHVHLWAQPAQAVAQKQPMPRASAGEARPRAVQRATHPQQHRAARHRHRDDLVRLRRARQRPQVRARDVAGCPAVCTKLAHGPHALQLQLYQQGLLSAVWGNEWGANKCSSAPAPGRFIASRSSGHS